MPLIIYADQREPYIRALERADSDQFGPFVRFIFDRCLDSMRFVAYRVAGVATPEPEEFDRLYTAQAGMTFQEINDLATRVINELVVDFREAWESRRKTSYISFNANGSQMNTIDSLGQYRGLQNQSTLGVGVGLSTPAPAGANAQATFPIHVAHDLTARFPFVVADTAVPDDRFDVRIEDILPANTTDFVMRRRAWVDKKLAELVSRLYAAARSSRGL